MKRIALLSLPVMFAVSFLGLWSFLLWPATPAQADIPTVLIDDFSTIQEPISVNGTNTISSSIVTDPVDSFFGVEREMTLTLTAGTFADAQIAAGQLDFRAPASVVTLTVSWTDTTGIDVTVGGQQNAFALTVEAADTSTPFSLTLSTDAANASVMSSTINATATPETYIIPFSAFATLSGTGADFSDADEIALILEANNLNGLTISNLTTINTLNATLTDELLVDDGNGLVDPNDTLRYTAVISNPADSSISTENNITFTLTPDLNTTLITGTVTTTQGTINTGNNNGDTTVDVAVGALADGAAVTITFDVLVNDPIPMGIYTIDAQGVISSSTLSGLLTDDSDDPTGNDDPTVTFLNIADLLLSKSADPEPAVAGTTMTYTLVITNASFTATTGIVLTDTLPPSTTLSSVDHIDDDNSPLGFGGGTADNLIWIDPRPDIDTDNERLTISDTAASLTGVFTSRVMDANSVQPWETLSWVPRRPYGKPLPNNGTAETSYDVGNVNMLANSVLLHLNDGTTVFTNTSGVGQNAVCPAAPGEGCPIITPVGGIFDGFAIFDGISSTIAISETSNPARYAIELWVSPAVTDTTSFVLQTDTYSTTVLTYSHMLGINDGFFVHSVLDDSGQLKTVTSTIPALPFTTYHLVGVAESNGDLKLFVNGQEEARRSDLGTVWMGGTSYRLGSAYGISGTASYYAGFIDELAIYNRTLSSGEILDRYIRGATSLEFQVRSCNDFDCDVEEFVGPDGTPGTAFGDVGDGFGLPTAVISTVVPINRYFQYQAQFFTADPAFAPELQQVVVTPDHPAIEASQGSCGLGTGTFTCTIGTLAPGQTATVTLQVNIHPSALGVITNTAGVTSTQGLSATVIATSTIISEVDLELAKNDVEDPVNIGSPLTYTIDVINNGPSTVLSATVTDTLPAGLTGTASGVGWSCTSGNAITCTIPSLLPGTYRDALVISTTAPLVEGIITNTAGITSTLTPETFITNNVTLEDTSILRLADLSIDKDDEPDPVLPGETLTYTITVENNGPYTATNVIVTDTLPSGLTANLASSVGWLCSPQIGDELVCAYGSDLATSDVASLTITVTAPVSGFLANTAVVASDITDPDLENNIDDAFTAIERVSDLSISKTDDPDPVFVGSPLTYTIVVTNDGPVPAGVFTTTFGRGNNGRFTLPILAGEANRYPGNINIGSIPGVIKDITVTIQNVNHTFPQDISLLLVGPSGRTVVLMSEAGGGSDINNLTLTFNDNGFLLPATDPLTDTVVYRPTNYGLSVPFANPAPAGPYGGSLSTFLNQSPNGQWQLYAIDTVDSDGGTIDGWRIEITAATTDTASVIDILPANTTVLTSTLPTGWAQTAGVSNTLEFFATNFEVGQPVTFTLEAITPITPGIITNTAIITTTDLDLNPDNNTAVITTTVLPLADLIITKTVNALTAPIGAELVYTLTVENLGPGTAVEPITITDFVPPELSNVTITPNGWNCNITVLTPLICTVDSLPLGLAPEIVITGDLPFEEGEIVNTAEVTTTITDPLTDNNTSTVTTTVTLPTADLVILKTAEPLTVPMGYPLTYTLTISNNGPDDTFRPITVTDNLPASLTDINIIATGWNCDTSSLPSLTCTLPSLSVGMAPDILITAVAPTVQGPLSNTAEVTGATLIDETSANNSATVTVQVSDIPISGLVATNSSPTVIGNVTMLQASIITGTNVSYVWTLGDGTILNGNPVSHTYPMTGTYTAMVTASNGTSVVTATTNVVIKSFYMIYLPIVPKQLTALPDLEVIDLVVQADAITITIQNTGRQPVTAPFWVDFYLNPTTPPVQANDIWQNAGGSGAVWGVEGAAIPLDPDQTIVLTLNDSYYRPTLSSLPASIPVGSTVYAHVDSANAGATTGAITEQHEELGLAYNNIIGPLLSVADHAPDVTSTTNAPLTIPEATTIPRSVVNLPPRPE